MDKTKKHILRSYKNEQEAIDEIVAIKEEMEKPIVSSESGYNFEPVGKENKYPTNPFSPGKMDIGQPGIK